MQYFTERETINLGNEIGGGGQAIVYEIEKQSRYVAKIYKSEPKEDIKTKLEWMINHPPKYSKKLSISVNVAWPKAILYNSRKQVTGYLMPYMENMASVFSAYNPQRRAKKMPNFDMRYRHRVALHMAWLVERIHEAGYVIGDMNESNWLVNAYGGVALIDTDSFQFTCKKDGQPIVFACPVGKHNYTAPEIQGKNFEQVLRNANHDRFALAILIYQLLNNGNHPFRFHWKGDDDAPSEIDRIKSGYFPYNSIHSDKIAPPTTTTYTLDTLSPEMQNLMQQCFVDGHLNPFRRPTNVLLTDTLIHSGDQQPKNGLRC